jgi:hypothetical protein
MPTRGEQVPLRACSPRCFYGRRNLPAQLSAPDRHSHFLTANTRLPDPPTGIFPRPAGVTSSSKSRRSRRRSRLGLPRFTAGACSSMRAASKTCSTARTRRCGRLPLPAREGALGGSGLAGLAMTWFRLVDWGDCASEIEAGPKNLAPVADPHHPSLAAGDETQTGAIGAPRQRHAYPSRRAAVWAAP